MDNFEASDSEWRQNKNTPHNTKKNEKNRPHKIPDINLCASRG